MILRRIVIKRRAKANRDFILVGFILSSILACNSTERIQDDTAVQKWALDSLGCHYRTKDLADNLIAKYQLQRKDTTLLRSVFGNPNVVDYSDQGVIWSYYFNTKCNAVGKIDTAADGCTIQFYMKGSKFDWINVTCS